MKCPRCEKGKIEIKTVKTFNPNDGSQIIEEVKVVKKYKINCPYCGGTGEINEGGKNGLVS